MTVAKVTDPGGTDEMFGFSVSSHGSTLDFQLADGQTWTSIVGTGQFTVSETDIPDGWSLKDLTCTGTTATYDGATATFTMVNNANVTCTFTNEKTRYENLEVTKTAFPSYVAEYDWSIEKVADQTAYTVAPDGSVEVGYTVKVTEEGVTYSAAKVTGVITITNPNDTALVLTGITDVLPGAECSVEAAPESVPANDSVTAEYTCVYPDGEIPDDGANKATVTWDKDSYYGTSGEAFATAGVVWADASVEDINKTVTVTDTQHTWDPEWTLTYGDDANIYEETYVLTKSLDSMDLTEGCYVFDNTATVQAGENVIDEDEAFVKLCELGVMKDIMGSTTAAFTWDLEKTALDPTEVIDPSGKHDFNYSVTVTPEGPEYSGSRLYGTITVTVPSGGAAVTGALTDFLDIDDATCIVQGTTDGTVTVSPDGAPRTFSYECDLGSTAPTVAVNTAVLTWRPGQQVATATATLEANEWDVTLSGEVIEVYDDMAGDADVLIGTVTVDQDGVVAVTPVEGHAYVVNDDGSVTFTYAVEHSVDPGECAYFTNTATGVPSEGDEVEDEATVELCAPADLVVTKTAETSYAAVYDWLIDKAADQTLWTVGPNGTANVTYTVTVTENGVEYRDVAVAGEITIENPNSDPVEITSITDAIDGAECTVTGVPETVPANGSVTAAYVCDFPQGATLPDDGINTATVEYKEAFSEEASTATGTADFSWDDAEVTDVDKTVTVTDTNYTWDPAWTLTYGDSANEYSKTYTLTYEGQDSAVCTTYDNTATVAGDEIFKEDSESVRVCTLDGSKTAVGTATADFTWDLEKTGGPDLVVDNSGSAVFDYEVTVAPTGPAHSQYQVSGEIVLVNPEGSEPVTGELTDFLGVDGSECVLQDTDEAVVTVPADGEDHVFSYTCTLPDLPEPVTVVNTAVFVWADGTQEVRATAEVAEQDWEIFLTNETLAVYDDMAGGADVLIGTMTVDLDGDVTVTPVDGYTHVINGDGSVTFTYTVEHSVDLGSCEVFVNTATGVPSDEGDQPEDEATVELCAELDLTAQVQAAGTFDVDYPWSITKDVDQSKFQLPAGSKTVDATYTVVVTAGDGVASNHVVQGTVSITHDNDWAKDFTVTALFPEGDCTADSFGIVAGNDTLDVAIECVLPDDYVVSEDDADNLLTVDVAWDPLEGGEAVAEAETTVAWTVDHEANASVVVRDVWQGSATPLGTLAWVDGELVVDSDQQATVDGNVVTFVYTLPLEVSGEEGCTVFENVAEVVGDGDTVIAKDQEDTTVCVDAPAPPVPGPGTPVPPATGVPTAPKLPTTGVAVAGLVLLSLGALLAGAGTLIVGKRRRSA